MIVRLVLIFCCLAVGAYLLALFVSSKNENDAGLLTRNNKYIRIPTLGELYDHSRNKNNNNNQDDNDDADGMLLTDAKNQFGSWMQQHGKVYASAEEEKKRFNNFFQSYQKVKQHNALGSSYRLGLTTFADMSDDEFTSMYRLKDVQKSMQECSATKEKKQKHEIFTTKPYGDLSPPKSMDWRAYGFVTPVKNQGHCGSCWTFSTTGTLEAHVLKNLNKRVSLSEQQLVDCAQAFNNDGCKGGLPSHAFEYIRYAGGIDSEAAYPYTAEDGPSCKFKKFGVKAKVLGSVNITQFDEKELQVAVGLIGPVSIAFQVVSDFRLYAGGVYSSNDCKNQPSDVNHAVVAVGYGFDEVSGKSYWIVKNSWGDAWGDGGYFKLEKGKNMCGVADCASFPLV